MAFGCGHQTCSECGQDLRYAQFVAVMLRSELSSIKLLVCFLYHLQHHSFKYYVGSGCLIFICCFEALHTKRFALFAHYLAVYLFIVFSRIKTRSIKSNSTQRTLDFLFIAFESSCSSVLMV